jgi:hypothetical protein
MADHDTHDHTGIPGVSSGSVATDPIWDAAGDLAVGTGANTAARVAIGTNGYVLTSNGTTAGWAAPAGGGLVLLEQHAASASATLDFTTWYSSTYDEYQIEAVNLVPATNAVSCYLRFSTNGGSSYDSGANYEWADYRFISSGSTFGGGAAQAQIGIDGGGAVNVLSSTASNGGLCGSYKLHSPGSSSMHKTLYGQSSFLVNSGGARQGSTITAVYKVTTAVDAFRVFMSSGNITSGTVRVYGIAK